MTELQAVDVSNYQGPSVDWRAVAGAGVALAICKASEGTWFSDPTFPRNWSGAKAAGLVRGAYHFARPDRGTDPAGEADTFLAHLLDISTGDILVLDLEVGSGDLSAWALAWLRHVEQKAGMRPWLYTGGWFAAGRLTSPDLGQYPLWNSAYTAVMPPAYAPWPLVTMWQYTEAASISGIGRCDASWFLGDHTALAKLGKPGPQPPPAPPSWPTGPVYKVTTVHYLRLAPRLDAAQGDLVAAGDLLDAAGGALLPSWTTNWRAVTHRATGHMGYAYAANLTLP